MKRLILSRKGFDAKAGGVASPILRDGRIYSLPIPQDYPSPAKYRDLNFDEISGADLLKETSASMFCTQQGKVMLRKSVSKENLNYAGAGGSSLEFRCLNQDHPEYIRADAARDSDVIIEHR